MDLNWCPVCEQHIPLAWESSLYCSERCKKADAVASSRSAFPSEMQSFSRSSERNSSSYASPSFSPMSSPLIGKSSHQYSTNTTTVSSSNTYPSPPTSPMSNYVYNKTSNHGGISPPSFSLGQPITPSYDLQLRRKSTTTISVPQYTMSSASKKGFFL
ncbi:hypothetical protein BGZ49_000594 [Haplosporangium sp. Z 27]|nr:hypothetical protein BGZ49_000594 [Haplosporangium sp. Z 27]